MTTGLKREMKRNTHQNILVLIAALCFFSFNFASTAGNAQTKPAVKPTPTPKPKKSPTSVKPTPKPSPKTSTNSKTTKTAADSKTTVKKTTDSKSNSNQKPTAVSKNKNDAAKPTAAPKSSAQIIVSGDLGARSQSAEYKCNGFGYVKYRHGFDCSRQKFHLVSSKTPGQ